MPLHDPSGLPACFLPQRWREQLAGASLRVQSTGESRATVVRVARTNAPDLFLKSEPVDAFSELVHESVRLRWLEEQGIAAARVLDSMQENGRQWLLTTAVPGADLTASPALSPLQRVSILADGLRELHALPIDSCPFDHRLPQRVAAARARVEGGWLDAADFDAENARSTPRELFQQLLARVPVHADLVVTHGDAYLANVMAEDGRFSGFVDCGRLGVADRHQDLALSAHSIAGALGAGWVTPFFARYGIAPDEETSAFYRLLDEFF